MEEVEEVEFGAVEAEEREQFHGQLQLTVLKLIVVRADQKQFWESIIKRNIRDSNCISQVKVGRFFEQLSTHETKNHFNLLQTLTKIHQQSNEFSCSSNISNTTDIGMI